MKQFKVGDKVKYEAWWQKGTGLYTTGTVTMISMSSNDYEITTSRGHKIWVDGKSLLDN